MKKSIGILLLAALLVLLAACSGTSPSQSQATISSSENVSEPPPSISPVQIDVTDLDALTVTYLVPVMFSGATQYSWTDGNGITANMLVDMYGYMLLWKGQIPESEMEFEDSVPYYYLDEAILEDYVSGYFELSIDHLRSSDRYIADRNAYKYNMSGVGFALDPRVLRAEYDDSSSTLILYLDDGHGGNEEAAALSVLLLDNGSFRYICNESK